MELGSIMLQVHTWLKSLNQVYQQGRVMGVKGRFSVKEEGFFQNKVEEHHLVFDDSRAPASETPRLQ